MERKQGLEPLDDATWVCDVATAFTPSPSSRGLLAELDAEEFFRVEEPVRCPLSTKCTEDEHGGYRPLEEEGGLLQHLRLRHTLSEHDAPRGVADISIPFKLDGVARRQAILLHFNGRAFLWTFQTRSRADGEQQISLALLLLPSQEVQSPKIKISSKAAPPVTLYSTEEQYEATLSVKDPRGAAQSGPTSLSWCGKVQLYANQRHEQLASNSQALVLCHLAHAHLIDYVQADAVRVHSSVEIKSIAS